MSQDVSEEKLLKKDRGFFKTTPRVCLKCRSKFPSVGVHNRLCTKCRHDNAERLAGMIPEAGSMGTGGFKIPVSAIQSDSGPVQLSEVVA